MAYSKKRSDRMDFVLTTCAVCGNAGTQKCGKCKNIRYCGPDCQKRHWPRHRSECGRGVAELVAAAPMAGVVRYYITLKGVRSSIPDDELGTYAALAETIPWMLHIHTACAILGMWGALETLLDRDPGRQSDPRNREAREGFEKHYRATVASCPSTPDPTHGQTRDFLSTLGGLHPRMKDTVLDLTQPWFTAIMKDFSPPSGAVS
jgi:hypothetical protein